MTAAASRSRGAAAVLLCVLLSLVGCSAPSGAQVSFVGSATSWVLGHGVPRQSVEAVHAVLDEVIPQVDALVRRPATLVLAIVGTDRPELDRSHLAAAAVTAQDGTGHLVVDAGAFDDAAPAAREVLLAHEVTHLRLQPVTSHGTPLWLVEGVADVVGYQVAGLQVGDVLSADPLPGRLPTEAELTAGDATAAYLRAWATCSYLATRLGTPALLGLFEAVASAADPATELAARLQPLGLSETSLPAAVDAYLAVELG